MTCVGTSLFYENGHQVPNNVARPPQSTTRVIAPRTLSFHEGGGGDDGRKPSNRRRSSSITSTRYTSPNCSRGTDIDGRLSTRNAGKWSAASKSETVTTTRVLCVLASSGPDSFFCSTSRRIRALHSSYPFDRVFGRGDDGWFATM
jgi:hypothetical protein